MVGKSNELKGAQELAGELAQRLGLEVSPAYDPDAARVRVVKIVCIVVPAVSFGVAAVVSAVLLGVTGATHSFGGPPWWLAGLLLVWGAAALATTVAVTRGFAMLREFRAAAPPTAGAGTPPGGAAAGGLPDGLAQTAGAERSQRVTRGLTGALEIDPTHAPDTLP